MYILRWPFLVLIIALACCLHYSSNDRYAVKGLLTGESVKENEELVLDSHMGFDTLRIKAALSLIENSTQNTWIRDRIADIKKNSEFPENLFNKILQVNIKTPGRVVNIVYKGELIIISFYIESSTPFIMDLILRKESNSKATIVDISNLGLFFDYLATINDNNNDA